VKKLYYNFIVLLVIIIGAEVCIFDEEILKRLKKSLINLI